MNDLDAIVSEAISFWNRKPLPTDPDAHVIRDALLLRVNELEPRFRRDPQFSVICGWITGRLMKGADA